MFSMMKRRSVLVLLIATLAWGCDVSPTEPIPTVDAPVQVEEGPSNLLGGLLGALGGILGTGVDLVFTVVEVVGDLGSALIGSDGGLLVVQDHSLLVLPRAVDRITRFEMEIIGGNRIEVDLRAIDQASGADVGEEGFDNPVLLSLSYANTDLSWRQIRKLVIVRIHEDGTREPLPSTVNWWTKQVTAELDHFSRYVLCSN